MGKRSQNGTVKRTNHNTPKKPQERDLALDEKFQSGDLSFEQLSCNFDWDKQTEYYAKEIQAKFGLAQPYDINNCQFCAAAALYDTDGYISDNELYEITKTRKVLKPTKFKTTVEQVMNTSKS